MDTPRELAISVQSIGSKPLVVAGVRFEHRDQQAAQRWRVDVNDALRFGLDPGRTSTVTITYRPCPLLDDDGRFIEGADVQHCPPTEDLSRLIILDNTAATEHVVTFHARPAGWPNLSVLCSHAPQCGALGTDGRHCSEIDFGAVSPGEPCRIAFDVVNLPSFPGLAPPALISELDVRVVGADGVEVWGRDIGFELQDPDGNPLRLPAIVPGAAPSNPGVLPLVLSFDPAEDGAWEGRSFEGRGLRLVSNRVIERSVDVVARTALPGAAVTPRVLTASIGVEHTVQVHSTGRRGLRVSAIRTTGPFAATPVRALATTVAPGSSLAIRVAATSTAAARGTLEIDTDDPLQPSSRVPIGAGHGPVLSLESLPSITLPVSRLRPSGTWHALRQIDVANFGGRRITITGARVLPIGDDLDGSTDDFRLDRCQTMPCGFELTLCPPSDLDCGPSVDQLTLLFRDNDGSIRDDAVLELSTDDPVQPTLEVRLAAQEVPCWLPTAQASAPSTTTATGTEFRVHGWASAAGNQNRIETYRWWWAAVSGGREGPTLTADGTNVSFTPTRNGRYVLALSVVNDCGAYSPTDSLLEILVTR